MNIAAPIPPANAKRQRWRIALTGDGRWVVVLGIALGAGLPALEVQVRQLRSDSQQDHQYHRAHSHGPGAAIKWMCWQELERDAFVS